MASCAERMSRFMDLIEGRAELVFFPMGTDLDYLTGIHRDIPNYGRNLHPGMWLEGAWLIPGRSPILTLPRMTVEFGAPDAIEAYDLRVLGDWDDPVEMVRGILREAGLSAAPVIATSDDAGAETLFELQTLAPGARFVSGTELLRPMRAIKSAEEIATLRRAGKITEAAFEAVVRQMRVGMSELEVVSELDYQMKRHGSLGPSFTTALYNTSPNKKLLFGAKEQSWPRRLTAPESVLFDFGAVLDGMCYDFGRTLCIGAPSAEQVLVHRLVMDSQRAGIAALRAGRITCEAVDRAARDVLVEAGYGDRFRHRLGHAIGWDVHEPPFLTRGDTTTVEEAMVFTIEPSIFQDGSASARVEDCVVAGPAGGDPLTSGFQDLIVIE